MLFTLITSLSNKSLLKKIKTENLVEIIETNINLLSKVDENIKISLKNSKNKISLSSDYEQLSRVFFNLLKNSIESIQEKAKKTSNISKIINIEINEIRDYININITDDGIGFINLDAKELIKPYFTTKNEGTGLGLSIVNKIINDHNGVMNFENFKNGAKVKITLTKSNAS